MTISSSSYRLYSVTIALQLQPAVAVEFIDFGYRILGERQLLLSHSLGRRLAEIVSNLT